MNAVPVSETASLLILKWLLFIFLMAFMPLIFATPGVGVYWSTTFLFIVGNAGLLFGLNPFALFVLAQVLVYVFLLYFFSRLIVRRLWTTGVGMHGWLFLAALLLIDALPIFGAGFNLSIFALYLEFVP